MIARVFCAVVMNVNAWMVCMHGDRMGMNEAIVVKVADYDD